MKLTKKTLTIAVVSMLAAHALRARIAAIPVVNKIPAL